MNIVEQRSGGVPESLVQLEAALETKPRAFLRKLAITPAAFIFGEPFVGQQMRRAHRPPDASGV